MIPVKPIATLPLTISAADLTAEEKIELNVHSADAHLGPITNAGKAAAEWLQAKAPSFIIRKIEKLVPRGYRIEQVELSFAVEADLQIGSLSGEANVTLVPETESVPPAAGIHGRSEKDSPAPDGAPTT